MLDAFNLFIAKEKNTLSMLGISRLIDTSGRIAFRSLYHSRLSLLGSLLESLSSREALAGNLIEAS